jgi:hypothetical protein
MAPSEGGARKVNKMATKTLIKQEAITAGISEEMMRMVRTMSPAEIDELAQTLAYSTWLVVYDKIYTMIHGMLSGKSPDEIAEELTVDDEEVSS